ncbi:choice-of-anchor I family protein [Streptomyces aidingensis]|uniref:DNA-binding beta-propeller fold protein YncE n=1 Tax=Streptomyces aidingensis TaxID=910347 RepID=A0A1I1EHC9_9ACTN|nr:choice-of-anchor I family protein [Streptomyces aidingensis]SFB86032.1 DNA-binding beta-propeller fold protein YncE [Streptomyces aidingensis]
MKIRRSLRKSALIGIAVALGTTLLTPAVAGAGGRHGGHGGHGGHGPAPRPGADLNLSFLGRYESGIFDEAAAEITAYDPDSRRIFVVSAVAGTVDVLDISDPSRPALAGRLPAPGANSVAIHDGLIAVAQQAPAKTDPGTVAFFRASDLTKTAEVTVGALPDALAFTPDGRRVVVANEGEPDSYCADGTDPEGSVSIITLTRHGRTGELKKARVRTAGFTAWNGREDALRAAGVRVYGPGASAAQDLEPEYAAVSADSRTAYVTLQENNAVAVVDLRRARVTAIRPLGLKDHSLTGNGLDASDRDGAVNITEQPVKGLYQPDSIAAFTGPGPGRKGRQYLITANEGDAREYDCYAEEERVRDLPLSPAAFPDAAALQADSALGRLTVTTTSPADEQGRYTELHALGGRSVSVLDSRGRLIWDSGDTLERLTAGQHPADFNANNDENGSFESRSDNKGPEPEGVVTGVVGGTPYAFVGLERISGIVAFDLSDPAAPRVAGYVSSRDFTGDAEAGTAGDLGPEGLTFIPAADSPTGRPMLAVGYEVSGTTALYEIDETD